MRRFATNLTLAAAVSLRGGTDGTAGRREGRPFSPAQSRPRRATPRRKDTALRRIRTSPSQDGPLAWPQGRPPWRRCIPGALPRARCAGPLLASHIPQHPEQPADVTRESLPWV
jgi:hypothetical protein